MDSKQIMNLAIAGGILYATWRFAPNASIKAMVLGVVGVAVAKQVPYVNAVV